MSAVFEDIERWFRRWMKFFEEIEQELEREMRQLTSGMHASAMRGRPNVYYYGFEITIGPDGKPIIREFGNVRPRIVEGEEAPGKIEVLEDVEPLTEVHEDEEKIRVIMELPGVEKDDIKVRLLDDNKTLIVEAHGKYRKYRKTVKLPSEVNPDSAKASYKNGVLTVELEKREKQKRSKVIEVE